MTAVFHGTQEEALALVDAMMHNCACRFGLMGVRVSTCPVHEALVKDQRWLDGLVWMRHCEAQLLVEEFGIAT